MQTITTESLKEMLTSLKWLAVEEHDIEAKRLQVFGGDELVELEERMDLCGKLRARLCTQYNLDICLDSSFLLENEV